MPGGIFPGTRVLYPRGGSAPAEPEGWTGRPHRSSPDEECRSRHERPASAQPGSPEGLGGRRGRTTQHNHTKKGKPTGTLPTGQATRDGARRGPPSIHRPHGGRVERRAGAAWTEPTRRSGTPGQGNCREARSGTEEPLWAKSATAGGGKPRRQEPERGQTARGDLELRPPHPRSGGLPEGGKPETARNTGIRVGRNTSDTERSGQVRPNMGSTAPAANPEAGRRRATGSRSPGLGQSGSVRRPRRTVRSASGPATEGEASAREAKTLTRQGACPHTDEDM